MATTKPTKLVIDVETGLVETVELTDQEIADIETARAEASANRAAEEAKVTARTSALAKLKELGLTEAEIAAL